MLSWVVILRPPTQYTTIRLMMMMIYVGRVAEWLELYRSDYVTSNFAMVCLSRG